MILEWNGKQASLEIFGQRVSAFSGKVLFSCIQRSTGNLVSVEVDEDGSANWWHNGKQFFGNIVKY